MCLDRQRVSPVIARRHSSAIIQRKIKSVINLNKFWTELEERYRDRTSCTVLRVDTSTEKLQNDINENIERLKRLRSADGQSGDKSEP